jgi:hypothetical protein
LKKWNPQFFLCSQSKTKKTFFLFQKKKIPFKMASTSNITKEVYIRNRRFINIFSAVFLGLAVASAMAGTALWVKNSRFWTEFMAKSAGETTLTQKLGQAYAWKYFHATAIALGTLSIALAVVGNAVNKSENNEDGHLD